MKITSKHFSIKQEEIEEDINGEHGIKKDVDIIKESLSETVQEAADKSEACKNHGQIIDTLCAIVIKQQETMDNMQNIIEDMRSRSMRENVVIHNVRENKDENILDAAMHALQKNGYDVTNITFDRIHRTGPTLKDKPCPIIAKPCRSAHVE